MKSLIKDTSGMVLIISNIVVILIAFIQNWSFTDIFFAYFFQGIIIGFFFFLKLIFYKKIDYNGKNIPLSGKIVYAVFLFFILGFFYSLYFNFVFMLILLPKLFNGGILPNPWLPALLFFISHLFSFIYNYKKESQEKHGLFRFSIGIIMRIFPMHLAIIFGGVVLVFWGFISILLSNGKIPLFIPLLEKIVLVFFMGIKTFYDYKLHTSEHEPSKKN